MDLSPFQRINPCGYAGLQVTSMLDLGGPSGLDAVKPVLLGNLAKQFDLQLQTAPPPDLTALAALSRSSAVGGGPSGPSSGAMDLSRHTAQG